ncbi:hypothetical protein [uncultured Aquimarina sp.]|uniref:hypothetical protein n=1 Tax=uncultured Aquimarina sp. TaxID=575652 RepID=UPI0026057ACF|nr:hypothetical protein [uncultured Aquimarina sp.]
MKNTKLDLQKFTVARLDNMNAIKGGSNNTSTTSTDEDSLPTETSLASLQSSLQCIITRNNE